jgi:hypothetical protein
VKPREGYVTVNVDAAFDPKVCEDQRERLSSKGNFLAASNNKVYFASHAATTEALCLRHGLHLLNQVGWNRIIIQCDCMEVINVQKAGGFTPSAAAPIIEDMCIHATSFIRAEYEFCPRESNFVAHNLANECGTQPNVWFEFPMSFIVASLIEDVSVIQLISRRVEKTTYYR